MHRNAGRKNRREEKTRQTGWTEDINRLVKQDSVECSRLACRDRQKWRALVHEVISAIRMEASEQASEGENVREGNVPIPQHRGVAETGLESRDVALACGVVLECYCYRCLYSVIHIVTVTIGELLLSRILEQLVTDSVRVGRRRGGWSAVNRHRWSFCLQNYCRLASAFFLHPVYVIDDGRQH